MHENVHSCVLFPSDVVRVSGYRINEMGCHMSPCQQICTSGFHGQVLSYISRISCFILSVAVDTWLDYVKLTYFVEIIWPI